MSKLWKTKTFWTGIASVATGIGMILAGEVPDGMQMIFIGFVAICGRQAITKIQNGDKK